jgi:hypothetical protein
MSETDGELKAIPALTKPTGFFVNVIFVIFFWCMGGVVVIYGIRLYHDLPIHPTFIPIIGAVFAAVLSFTLVMTLQIYSGTVSIKAGSGFALEGASGPIVLWCLCFLSVCYGLYLLGVIEVAKTAPSSNYISCSVHDAWKKKCIYQVIVEKNPKAESAVISSPNNP